MCFSHLGLDSSSTPKTEPVAFNPDLLDAKATGGINADETDVAILRWAESLPMHRSVEALPISVARRVREILIEAFLSQRHILVTAWARGGIYDVDFGFRSRILYADAVLPVMDGAAAVVFGIGVFFVYE
ncbi:transferase family protein [Apiospora rasikravindrae]|uniref:Transferase family protein n=1 Tax=Apiospora rasikravindrae TaxID=990691 RepID=A0ABR1SEH9_9PEZI